MKFNPGDGTGVIDEINDICQSDNNSYPLEAKTRRVNSAMDRFFTLAFKADGRWTFDDLNQGSDPIETQDLVTGQQTYSLDDFTSEIINVLGFEILDEDGNPKQLTRLKREQSLPLTDYKSTNGTPDEYDLVGNTIYLYPAPDYDYTDGLKIYFNRAAVKFLSTDTDVEPGIPSIFHEYICRLAALPYLIEFQKPQKNDIAALIAQDEKEIEIHFAHREKGQGENMTMAGINFR
jgi:hypothetical protein